MAANHELLSQTEWTGADLRALIEVTLRSHVSPEGRSVILDGPNVVRSPSAATTTGMVLYELTTNAAKYGTLQQAGGRISVTWAVEAGVDGTMLRLDWSETTATPPAGEPTAGFGTSFIRRSIAYELGGRVSLDLARTGLHCRIEFPLKSDCDPAVPRAD